MPFKTNAQKAACVHDKSKSTFRENAKQHVTEEKKQMEHEFITVEKEIMKALNDKYEFSETRLAHEIYEVIFFNRVNKDKKSFRIEFGENYNKLKELWEEELEA